MGPQLAEEEHRPQLDSAIARLMLPILPYSGAGTFTTEDAASASTADLVACAEHAPPAAAISPSPTARRRFTDPTPASWVVPAPRPSTSSACAADAGYDTPPPAYEALYPPARRARSLSSSPAAHTSSRFAPASAPAPPSYAPAPTTGVDESPWGTRPTPRSAPRSFDSGYASVAGGSGSGTRGGDDGCPVQGAAEGRAGGEDGAPQQRRPGVLKRMGRTISREFSRPWAHPGPDQLGWMGYSAMFA
ncbi:hypothetical protein JCM10450v2_004567 [Rhodotorula kratochvilovae]